MQRQRDLRLVARLQDLVDEELLAQVGRACEAGAPWAEIGLSLGCHGAPRGGPPPYADLRPTLVALAPLRSLRSPRIATKFSRYIFHSRL